MTQPRSDVPDPNSASPNGAEGTEPGVLRFERRGGGGGGDAGADARGDGGERRDSVVDRRTGVDRREAAKFKVTRSPQREREDELSEDELRDLAERAPGAPAGSGLERRRGAGRRLSDFSRAAEEGELTREQFLFVMAIQEFKRANNRSFPSWTDVLEVIRLLGYRKTQASELNIRSAEDWRESFDAPSAVRPKGWEKRAA